ncbi:MAG: hypothetical protein HC882_09600 [Acidobacteria bacterium]|nr:hypothetical protein [Acidobacteriota bacterium]
MMALAAPAYGISQMLSQVFIASGDTRTPMIVGFYRLGVKVVLSLALFFPLGLLGLAIASTLSAFFRTGMLWARLGPEARPPGGPIRSELLRTLTAGVGAGVAGWGTGQVLPGVPWGVAGKAPTSRSQGSCVSSCSQYFPGCSGSKRSAS